MTLCLGDIVTDWKASQAGGRLAASVSKVIVVMWSGMSFLQCRIAKGIVSSSAGSDSGEGIPVGGM